MAVTFAPAVPLPSLSLSSMCHATDPSNFACSRVVNRSDRSTAACINIGSPRTYPSMNYSITSDRHSRAVGIRPSTYHRKCDRYRFIGNVSSIDVQRNRYDNGAWLHRSESCQIFQDFPVLLSTLLPARNFPALTILAASLSPVVGSHR